MKTIIGTAEKYRRRNVDRNTSRRNDEGLTAREQAKQDKIKAVKELRANGMTQYEIAEKLQIKQGTVSKYLTF